MIKQIKLFAYSILFLSPLVYIEVAEQNLNDWFRRLRTHLNKLLQSLSKSSPLRHLATETVCSENVNGSIHLSVHLCLQNHSSCQVLSLTITRSNDRIFIGSFFLSVFQLSFSFGMQKQKNTHRDQYTNQNPKADKVCRGPCSALLQAWDSQQAQHLWWERPTAMSRGCPVTDAFLR